MILGIWNISARAKPALKICLRWNNDKIFLDEEKIISGHFKSEQIEHYTRELGSRIEAIIYLWAFNNFSVHYPDDLEDLGRPMYRKLAEKLSKILCVTLKICKRKSNSRNKPLICFSKQKMRVNFWRLQNGNEKFDV